MYAINNKVSFLKLNFLNSNLFKDILIARVKKKM